MPRARKINTELLKDDNLLWLREQNTHVLKEAMKDLLIAYENFFNKTCNHPKYKLKSDNKQSCRFDFKSISRKNIYTNYKISLANIKKDVNLFISYTRNDYELAKHIYSRLNKYDYNIFFDIETLISNNFPEQIKTKLVQAAKEGNILLVYTDNYKRSYWCYQELKMSIKSAEKERVILIDLTKDGAENSLKEKVTYIRPKSNEYDDICDLVLTTLLNPGNILTYCREFRDGERREKDSFEAKRLGNLFYEFAKEKDNANSPTGVICMGICYEEGLGVKKDLLKAYSYFSDYVATDGSTFAKERALNLSKILFTKSEQQKPKNKNLAELIINFIKRFF